MNKKDVKANKQEIYYSIRKGMGIIEGKTRRKNETIGIRFGAALDTKD